MSTPPAKLLSTPPAQAPCSIDLPAESFPNVSNNPWAKMFAGRATPEQLQMFINGFLKSMIHQFKLQDQKWKQTQQRLKEELCH